MPIAGHPRTFETKAVTDPGAYLRRDVHPWDEQNLHLVESWRDEADASQASAAA